MRYELDELGYVKTVAFGCNTGMCEEYTGTVPAGYYSLVEWSTYAKVNAYYIDENGNLALNPERFLYLEDKEAQQAIDNTPLYRKDLYGSEEIQDSQYKKSTQEDYVMMLPNCMPLEAKVTISNVSTSEKGNLLLYIQSRNMLRGIEFTGNSSEKLSYKSGVTFKAYKNGSITVNGTATEDIEYVIAERTDGIPLFVLKANQFYGIRTGGLRLELQYFDGETTVRQYIGTTPVLKFDRQVKVSRVAVQIDKGQTVDTSFYPELEYGDDLHTPYEEHKEKILTIDLSKTKAVTPGDSLYPGNDLFIRSVPEYIDVHIEKGKIYTFINDVYTFLGYGHITLHKGNNTIYTSQTETAKVKIEYSIDETVIESMGTSDTGFRLYKDALGVWNLAIPDGIIDVSKLNVFTAANITGNLSVTGTKSRSVGTENYGERLLYCYETPSPMFGDLGEGQLDATGKCYIFIDDVFAETVDSACAYQVFLQPYGDGKCYVEERTSTYFVVCGTAGLKFGWELKCIQKNYDTIRLEQYENSNY